jgi:hypothetical protein
VRRSPCVLAVAVSLVVQAPLSLSLSLSLSLLTWNDAALPAMATVVKRNLARIGIELVVTAVREYLAGFAKLTSPRGRVGARCVSPGFYWGSMRTTS